MRTVAVGTAKGLFVLEQSGTDPTDPDWVVKGPYLSGWEVTDGMVSRSGMAGWRYWPV